MTDYKLVPVEPIRRAMDALERFANDTLAGRNSAHELRELLDDAPAVQGEPGVTQLVEAITELCDEIDKHEIHSAISKTSISWFKRKARKALAAYRKGGVCQ